MKWKKQVPSDDSLDLLLERFSQGDARVFEPLYQATVRKMLGVAYQVLRNRAAAEEVVQDVYLKIWKHPECFDLAKGRALVWLLVVTRRQCLDVIRRNRRVSYVDPADLEADADNPLTSVVWDSDPTDAIDQEQKNGLLRDCLSTLNSNYREAIVLAYWRGWTIDETAHHLDKPLGTVKSWIRRGLLSLRECLGAKSSYATVGS